MARKNQPEISFAKGGKIFLRFFSPFQGSLAKGFNPRLGSLLAYFLLAFVLPYYFAGGNWRLVSCFFVFFFLVWGCWWKKTRILFLFFLGLFLLGNWDFLKTQAQASLFSAKFSPFALFLKEGNGKSEIKIDQLEGRISRFHAQNLDLDSVQFYIQDKKYTLPYARIVLEEGSTLIKGSPEKNQPLLFTQLSLPVLENQGLSFFSSPQFLFQPGKSQLQFLSRREKEFAFSPLYFQALQQVDTHLVGINNQLFKTFTFNRWDGLDFEIRQQIEVLGIFHLLVISGLHIFQITFLSVLLFRALFSWIPFLQTRNLSFFLADFFALGFSFSYVALIGFPLAALRSVLFFAFWKAMESFLPFYPSFIRLILGVLVFLLWAPNLVGSLSLNLSFLAIFAILFSQRVFGIRKRKFFQQHPVILYCASVFVSSLFINLILFPAQIGLLQNFNPWQPVNNLFHIFYCSWVILPLCLLVLPFSVLNFFAPNFFLGDGLYSLIDFVFTLWTKFISWNYQLTYLFTWKTSAPSFVFFIFWAAGILFCFLSFEAFYKMKKQKDRFLKQQDFLPIFRKQL